MLTSPRILGNRSRFQSLDNCKKTQTNKENQAPGGVQIHGWLDSASVRFPSLPWSCAACTASLRRWLRVFAKDAPWLVDWLQLCSLCYLVTSGLFGIPTVNWPLLRSGAWKDAFSGVAFSAPNAQGVTSKTPCVDHVRPIPVTRSRRMPVATVTRESRNQSLPGPWIFGSGRVVPISSCEA